MASNGRPVQPVFHVVRHVGFIRHRARHTGADKTRYNKPEYPIYNSFRNKSVMGEKNLCCSKRKE